jgi:hypothetical protein
MNVPVPTNRDNPDQDTNAVVMSNMFDAINQMHPRYRSADADKLFKPTEYKVIDNKVFKLSDVVVHTFAMGDVEDPDLYAARLMLDWQNSEAGAWVMENALEQPFWHRHVDPIIFGYRYYIVARLRDQDQTYWALKWQKS